MTIEKGREIMGKKKNAAGDILFLVLFVILAIYLYSLAGK